MKKLIAILLVGILLIGVASFLTIGFSYDRFEKKEQEHIISLYKPYNSRIYTAEKDMQNEALRNVAPMVDEFFELLPDEKANEFRRKGWKIIISSQKPSYITDMESSIEYKVGGNTEYNKRIIFVHLNELSKEYLLSDFIHEFGHFDDWENGIASKTDDFVKIFKNNKGYVPEDAFEDVTYHLKSSREFFACCYKDYFLYGDKLKSEAPEVYNFISNAVNNEKSEAEAFYMRIFNLNKKVDN